MAYMSHTMDSYPLTRVHTPRYTCGLPRVPHSSHLPASAFTGAELPRPTCRRMPASPPMLGR
jgi:hypothetical protein